MEREDKKRRRGRRAVPEQYRRKRPVKKIITIAAGAAALCIVAVLLILWLGKGKGKENTTDRPDKNAASRNVRMLIPFSRHCSAISRARVKSLSARGDASGICSISSLPVWYSSSGSNPCRSKFSFCRWDKPGNSENHIQWISKGFTFFYLFICHITMVAATDAFKDSQRGFMGMISCFWALSRIWLRTP